MATQKRKFRNLRNLALVILVSSIGYGVYYCWVSFPIISGYGAKVLCSSVFVAGRAEQQVRKEDIASFPLSLGHYTIDYKDSSVTGSVWGLAKTKAIYRSGLGATLVSEWTEQQVREEKFRLAQRPALRTDTLSWPMGDRVADTVPAGLDMAALHSAIDAIFMEKDTAHPIKTRAVIVLYKGQLVGERYAPGFTRDTRLLGWSMSKSITSALIGMLVGDGRLHVDAPAPVPEWKNPDDPRHAITLVNLLQQCSGLQFEENYTKSSDATKMLFERADMGAYTASHPEKDTPGTVWYYSSGNSNIVARIVRQTVGEEGYHAFPYERLFYKTGMYSAVLEPDASGTFVGSSYSYATARDWARFGLLYLNDGVFNGERLLPEGWVRSTATPAPAAPKGKYGYMFWLNAGTKGNPGDRTYPHAPADLFCADGFEGQNVFIIPSRQLVVVRLGLTTHGKFNADRFLGEILGALR
ncbi:MAG TPA: serine hydrolase [Puia sp.]|nr:serine hydrolase [Puia sp.]